MQYFSQFLSGHRQTKALLAAEFSPISAAPTTAFARVGKSPCSRGGGGGREEGGEGGTPAPFPLSHF